MYTFLPEETIKTAQREYHVRLLILFLFCLSAAVWIGIVSLFPSYIISLMQEGNAIDHLQAVKKTMQAPVNAGVSAEVASSNATIILLKNSTDPVVFSSIIEEIAHQRISGIVLNDIEISHAPVAGDAAETTVAARGVAATRDILVAFQNALVNDPEFSQVTLPISDLARGTDIPFSITFSGLH